MANRGSNTVLHLKQRCGSGGDLHLLAVSGGFESLAAGEQRIVDFRTALDCRAEQGLGRLVQVFVCWIEQDDTPIGTEASEQFAEGAAQGLVGPV